MLATAFGPAKDYCRPFAATVIDRMSGISQVAMLYDGTAPEFECDRLNTPFTKTFLPEWDGGEDPHRYGRLARMRRALVDKFLASDCEYLYFHDVDTIPPFDIIERLIALDAPVCTGSYSMRGSRYAMPAWMESVPATLGDDVVMSEGYGMGCMLIRRDALEATEFRPPEYWVGKDAPGEDWQWSSDSCLPVHCDTRQSCWHVCDDGSASRIVFGDLVNLTVWLGDSPVRTKHGCWKRMQTRTTVSEADQSRLRKGFACGPARAMTLDWSDVTTILAGGAA